MLCEFLVVLDIPQGQPAENEEKDAPHPNRFSAVIEKIERLYMVCYTSSHAVYFPLPLIIFDVHGTKHI